MSMTDADAVERLAEALAFTALTEEGRRTARWPEGWSGDERDVFREQARAVMLSQGKEVAEVPGTGRDHGYRYVEVHWHDAQAESGWSDPGDLPSAVLCVTRGWLVKEGPNEIVVAMTVQLGPGSNGADVGGAWAIHRSMIRSVRTVSVRPTGGEEDA